MRAMLCEAPGPAGALTLAERPPPRLKPGEALIRVAAAGVNFPDRLMVAGLYQYKPPPPFVPGMEISGEVVALRARPGSAVRPEVRPGARVVAALRGGGFAELATAPLAQVRPVPDGFDDIAAAAYPVAAQTARVALVERGGLGSRDRVLVLGAGGGVGRAAVQLAAAHGATVIAVASTAEKRAAAAAAGARHLLAPEGDLKPQVGALTGGRGADLVYDPVGGALFERAIRALAWGGRYLVVGFASGRIPTLAVNRALIRGISVIGVRAGEQLRRNPASGPRIHRAIDRLAARGKLTPHVHAVLPLRSAAAALAALADRSVVGKIVLRVGDAGSR